MVILCSTSGRPIIDLLPDGLVRITITAATNPTKAAATIASALQHGRSVHLRLRAHHAAFTCVRSLALANKNFLRDSNQVVSFSISKSEEFLPSVSGRRYSYTLELQLDQSQETTINGSMQKVQSFPDNSTDFGDNRRKLCEDRAHMLAELTYDSLAVGDDAIMLCATAGQVINSFEALALTQRRMGFENFDRRIKGTVYLKDMLFAGQKRNGIIFQVETADIPPSKALPSTDLPDLK